MANKTIAVHTSEEIIAELTARAQALRRSRNSLIEEALETILEQYARGDRKMPEPRRTVKAGAR